MSDANLPPEIEALRQAYLSALRGWTGEIERLKAENEKLRAEVQKLDSECTDLATDLCTQRQDNASLAEPWKVLNPLRAENERLRAALQTISLMDKVHEHDLFSATRVAIKALQDKSDASGEAK